MFNLSINSSINKIIIFPYSCNVVQRTYYTAIDTKFTSWQWFHCDDWPSPVQWTFIHCSFDFEAALCRTDVLCGMWLQSIAKSIYCKPANPLLRVQKRQNGFQRNWIMFGKFQRISNFNAFQEINLAGSCRIKPKRKQQRADVNPSHSWLAHISPDC